MSAIGRTKMLMQSGFNTSNAQTLIICSPLLFSSQANNCLNDCRYIHIVSISLYILQILENKNVLFS